MAEKWDVKVRSVQLFDASTWINLLATRESGEFEAITLEIAVAVPGRRDERSIQEWEKEARRRVREGLASLLEDL